MTTFSVTDSGREASRQRTFTRREFLAYEAVMNGQSPPPVNGDHIMPGHDAAQHDLDEPLTWEQWTRQAG